MQEKGKFDPYAAGSSAKPPPLPTDALATGKMYFYFAARGLGIFIIVCGLYLVLNVFGLVKTLIEDPQTLMAHVNAWAQPMDLNPEAPPGEVSALSESDTEALATGENAVELDAQQVDDTSIENAMSSGRRVARRPASNDTSVSGLVEQLLDALE